MKIVFILLICCQVSQSILHKNPALAETLSGDGPFTVFAPTNEAFEKLPQSVVDALMADPEALKKVLLYHVIPAEIKSSDITEDDVSVASAEGTNLRVNTYMKRFYYDVSLSFFLNTYILHFQDYSRKQ